MKYNVNLTKKKSDNVSLSTIDLNTDSNLTVAQLKDKIVERLKLPSNLQAADAKLLINEKEKEDTYSIKFNDKIDYSFSILDK